MPLEQLVSLVEDVVHSQAAHGPASGFPLSLRPVLTPGRGEGIRTFEDYLNAFKLVEAAFADRDELVSRLRIATQPRHVAQPGLTLDQAFYAPMYTATAAQFKAPAFYWSAQDTTGDLSRAWDVVTGTGYVDVLFDPTKPRQLVAIWPLWYALNLLRKNALHPTLIAAQGDPPEFTDPPDYVTWAGGLAHAWMVWNTWRRAYHGQTPVAQWPSVETTPLDPAPLQRAIARGVPREDLDGFLDAINIVSMVRSRPADPLNAVINDYYTPKPVVSPPTPPNVSYRFKAFLTTSTAFATLSNAGTLDKAHVVGLVRAVLPAALGRLASRSQREDEARTPWGTAAFDTLADQFAAYVTEAPATGQLGGWAPSGFGARTLTLTADTPIYGGWDLQFGDDDATLSYGGYVRQGDPGGHVASLVADLNTLGFTAPTAGTSAFDARVAMAVREFQIEASQPIVYDNRTSAPGAVPAWRRYLGNVHGIVDAETRRMLQLWLNLPRVQGDPAEFASQANVQNAHNGLLVVASSGAGKRPTASQIVAGGADVWGPKNTFDSYGCEQFDFGQPAMRHWAIDYLERWGKPIAKEAPNLSAFGPPVAPAQKIDAVPLGRYSPPKPPKNPTKLTEPWDLPGGPWTKPSDHWKSTRLTLARFMEEPRTGMKVRDDDWPILYGMTFPETYGYADVINGYDTAWLSFGWCHWTLVIQHKNKKTKKIDRINPGEMGALLAWYRWRDPAGFNADFASWGIQAQDWLKVKKTPERPGQYNAKVRFYGVRRAVPNTTTTIADPFTPRYPDPLGDDSYLEHTWMRSWRSVYRVDQALRLSRGWHAATREFAVRRMWEVLNHAWTGTTVFSVPAGAAPVTIGTLFTSQQAIVALMRYHINLPPSLFGGPASQFKVRPALDNAIANAALAYQNTAPVSSAPVDASTLNNPASPKALAFQTSLINELASPTAKNQRTIAADKAIVAKLPGNTRFGAALSDKPGSYPGPEDQRNYV